MLKLSAIITSLFIAASLVFWFTHKSTTSIQMTSPLASTIPVSNFSNIPVISNNNTALPDLPPAKTLQTNYHIFQTFNNCGPASLSMALSYFGINKSQEELGKDLRPYQNPQGDNDDKSVTFEELGKKAEEFGLKAYKGPNGDINKVKQFVAAGIPVIARTYLKKDDDIGHYRIVKGYDDNTQEIIQDDSFQGKNIHYSYGDFNDLWRDFNFEYLILFPKEKQPIVEEIIGEDISQKVAWQKTVSTLEQKQNNNPSDVTTLFNLSIALYRVGDYAASVKAFEQVESRLPFRALWYQIEPIYSYYELGNYDRVMQIADRILNNHNRAFSELYILRARVYLKQNNKQKAAEQLAQAKLYNQNIYIEPELLNQIK